MIGLRALIVTAVLLSALPDAREPWAAGVAADPVSARERADEVVAAIEAYRATLEELLPMRERDLARAIRLREQRREFLERSVVSRREFVETETAVATAERMLDDTRLALGAAADAMAEASTARALVDLRPLGPGVYEQDAALIRYNGAAVWSLKPDTAKLRQFFASRFGRPLPVSALGQTPLHDRIGFDHRDALDVAVHPDSAEGRALIDHLRAAGIPFIASRNAVPGSATGAHIHVGQPSPRIASKR